MSPLYSKFKNLFQNTNPFWLATIAIASGLILPLLFMDGMFFDGLILSTVSRNFAFDFKGFWQLSGGQEFLNPFYDQPPLMFWLNGLFYKLVGDTIYTERMYSLLMAIIQMLIVNAIWKTIFHKEKKLASYAWLPVLFWAVIPVNNFVIINNMEEATMPIFILLSVLFMFKYLLIQERAIYLVWAGIFVFLAVLTKGIQCSFSIVLIPCYWLSKKKYSYQTIKWMLSKSSIVFIVFSIPFAVLFLYPPSKNFIANYFEIRLVKSFADSVGEATTDTHFYLLARIFMELIPVIALLFIGTVIYYLVVAQKVCKYWYILFCLKTS